MLQTIPLGVCVLVLATTLLRGNLVRKKSGVSAWAFWSARGRQRAYGALFALSGVVIYAAAAALALKVGSGRVWTLQLGNVLALAGGGIVMLAQHQMGQAWRVGVRSGDAPLFVESGLFRCSRNPIFVGMCIMGLGVALGLGAWWAWLAAIAFVLACHLQIEVEEAHLAAAFGSDYDKYRLRVPRWVWR